MGLFDSECALSGLSLNPFDRVAAIALRSDGRAGEVVLGVPDRVGGIEAPVPSPYVLAAPAIVEAARAHGALDTLLAQRGSRGVVGAQHTPGDVAAMHARAVREAAAPWMALALDACAREAESVIARRLGAEAPPSGWLLHAATSWWGVVAGEEREATTSLDRLFAMTASVAHGVFDRDTLELTGRALLVAVDRGEVRTIDLTPMLTVVLGDERARLDDPEGAARVYARWDPQRDPTFELASEALQAVLPPLTSPHAPKGSMAFVASRDGERPVWARAGETAHGLTAFARIG